MEYTFDLHLHSCLTPYADETMTPQLIATECALEGYDIVALTDYNSCGNSAAFQAAAETQGILAIPGMELCLREDAHVICLFPTLEQAQAFSALVRTKLPNVENNPEVFGHQTLVDENDQILGEETAFLVGACDIGVYEIVDLVELFGGVVYPAHLELHAFSLLSNLGLWDPAMKFHLAEVTPDCPPEFFDSVPGLSGIRRITGCNARRVEEIPPVGQTMELPELTAQAVIDWLKAH